MKLGVKLFITAIALAVFNPLWAETFTYEALTDFTDTNAGEVPYYRHNGVNALAINAAIEEYRDKFARATLDFEENTGVYDVTITSLGEIDGDGEFRFLVNGEVVGSAVNDPVTEDFGEQHHTFENISIPQGALIGVESIAVSNGKIPEGNAYAYARGRWTTLTITDAVIDTATPDPVESVDLSVNITVDSESVIAGEELNYTIEVENLSQFVATNPVANVSLPSGITDLVSNECVENVVGIASCELAELMANESATFTITVTAATAGEKVTVVEVSADQDDDIASNNSNSVSTLVENEQLPDTELPVTELPTDSSVDLQLAFTSDKQRLEVGENLVYNLNVANLHESNVATSPVVGIMLPDSLQFEASDKCVRDALVIRCDLEEIPPGGNATAQFTASAVKVNSYSQIFATASSAQPENSVSDNEAQIVTEISPETLRNIVPVNEQLGEAENTVDSQSKDSGGGTFQSALLLLLLLHTLYYRQSRKSGLAAKIRQL